jgi:putative Ca2+/H+ antiporter (TMEM165/GDT1 family)
MDALMAALVAAALAQVGDRTAWLAAILSDRYRKPRLVILAAALALLLAGSLAVAGGITVAPLLTPNARQLMLALALILQGGGALLPVKAPDPLRGWRTGAIATTMLGLFILAFGDGIQLIVAALALRSAVPMLAAVGATIGSLVVIVPAAMMGEATWRRGPLARLRTGIGLIFVVLGVILGLSAARLI